VVLWAVHALATHAERPGHIVNIGSIHFARWVVLPGTARLLFFSNYGGTWVSYLEDFIARAAAGLSAIWSNTQDFPRTRRLTEGGAADGERFKRWARRQQIPTLFWYTAYPELTTSRIRANAAIRHGFAGASTEAAAAKWLLDLSFPMPRADGLQMDDVPTLVFGGLKPLNCAHALLIRFGPRARDWLAGIEHRILYGEVLPQQPALVIGLTASGLEQVAGDPAVLQGFPTAFQHGMAAPWRARALGDTGGNAPEKWWWGWDRTAVDAIVVIYARDAATLDREVAGFTRDLQAGGHAVVHQLALDPVPPKGQDVHEPFGFIDGISQPVIRGTRRWQTHRPSIHQVEPGEMVLGQRDNLGCVTPAPRFHGVDIGSNGTFLVVRQLEQHDVAFERYLDDAVDAIRLDDDRLPAYIQGKAELRKWIEAKMVGRWREDGSSLVRHPQPPGTPNRVTVKNDNDFLFGAEDPHGLACPFGAHIRRANPRDSFEPGSGVQIGITNRHRIFRVGRTYDARQPGPLGPGLLFMCVNADIEGQFEFLQRTWAFGRSFHGLPDEVDPVVGDRAYGADTMTIPTPNGPLRLNRLANFVTVRGGAYFFLPGRAALRRLLQL
jgi:Dyp-type peroxidase family